MTTVWRVAGKIIRMVVGHNIEAKVKEAGFV